MKNYLTETHKKMDKLGFKTYQSYRKYLIKEKIKNNEKLNTQDLLDSFTKLELVRIIEKLSDNPNLIIGYSFNAIIKSFINYFKDIKKENRKKILKKINSF